MTAATNHSAKRRAAESRQQYWRLHGKSARKLVKRGCTEVVVAGSEAHARWTAARARCPPVDRAKRGEAQGTTEALQQALGRTAMCARCMGLVHFEAARRQAKAEGRVSFEAGDGCTNASCTSRSQPARYKANQTKMAEALLGHVGKPRDLILWPATAEPRTSVWIVPHTLAQEAALAALAAVARPPVHAPPHCHM